MYADRTKMNGNLWTINEIQQLNLLQTYHQILAALHISLVLPFTPHIKAADSAKLAVYKIGATFRHSV